MMSETDIPCNAILALSPLEGLIALCKQQWRSVPPSVCFEWSVGPIAGEWNFSVTNSWQNWSEKNLKHQFRAPTLRGCLIDFLGYVRDHQIDVFELSEKA